jgi:hypothetical protein
MTRILLTLRRLQRRSTDTSLLARVQRGLLKLITSPLIPLPKTSSIFFPPLHLKVSPSHSLSLKSGKYISLDELHQRVRRANARKLPGPPSPDLRDMMIRDAITPWADCALHYLRNVEMALGNLLVRLCDKHFARFKKSGLHAVVR